MISKALIVGLIFLLAFPLNGISSAPTFLDDSAGMAAYFQFTGPPDLSSALLRDQFRVIEDSKASYLLGSVACTGFESEPTMDANVFVHQSGWVVAYFPKDRAISQIVNEPKNAMTRLDQVLARIAAALGVSSYSTAYTHFQYPQATELIRIGRERANLAGESSMDVFLPTANTYYEDGWSLRIQNSLASGWFKIDQQEIGITPIGLGPSIIMDGKIQAADLLPNVNHVVTVGLSANGLGTSYGELDLLISGLIGVNIPAEADWLHSMPLQSPPEGLTAAALDAPRFLNVFLPMVTR